MRQEHSLHRPLLALMLATGVAAGCSSGRAPQDQLAGTRTAIEVAQAAGANESTPEMDRAREKLAQAETAVRANDMTRARRLAEEAEVDALAARSRASSDKASKAAAELDASLATLREEMTRQSSGANPAPMKP